MLIAEKLKKLTNKINSKHFCAGGMRIFIFNLFFSIFIFSIGINAVKTAGISCFINYTLVLQEFQLNKIVMPVALPGKEENKFNITESESNCNSYSVLFWIGNSDTHEKTSIHHYYTSGDSSPTIIYSFYI